MLRRWLASHAQDLRAGYPAILVTGPRQSGKTTFARMTFTDLPYVNLESPLEQADFRSDPLGFLARFEDGAVIDEAQNLPELFRYLQVRIDADPRMGRWILTGSQQVLLDRSVSQSLAGRVALLKLLPFSHSELAAATRRPRTLAEAVLRGGYPPLYDDQRKLEPSNWLENYLTTFVNRDIRAVLEVRQRGSFDTCLRLCASRTGQLLNKSELATECGVDGKTIDSWLDVLEICYVIRLLRPHHRRFGKRLVKRPKLHFVDSGLACRLLHITDVHQLVTHPLWGALVETWCFTEVLKSRVHRGKPADLWFWRSSDGIEVDILIEHASGLAPIEVKPGLTPSGTEAAGIRRFRDLAGRESGTRIGRGTVIYGGDERRSGADADFIPWHAIAEELEPAP